MTSNAFNYIRSNLPRHDFYNVEYCATDDLDETVNRIHAELKALGRPFSIVSHSLGGVIGLRMLQEKLPISRLITLSSPLGGIEFRKSFISAFSKPIFQTFLPDEIANFINFANQLTPSSKVFRDLHSKEFDPVRVFSVVTNYGALFSSEDSDMVVTVKSQRHFPEVSSKEINCSHGEVLLRPEVVKIIAQELNFIARD
jgi:pimeloyl-ACP methyl ester carboxylesterase